MSDGRRLIPLTRGKFATVDAEDYEFLMQWKWHATASGYAARRQGRMIRMHRDIMSPAEGQQIDHIDGNKLNNCRDNLRLATASQNQFNRGAQRNSSSGVKGVDWYARYQCWRARMMIQGRRITIGYFSDIAIASAAYSNAALTLQGDFAHIQNLAGTKPEICGPTAQG